MDADEKACQGGRERVAERKGESQISRLSFRCQDMPSKYVNERRSYFSTHLLRILFRSYQGHQQSLCNLLGWLMKDAGH